MDRSLADTGEPPTYRSYLLRLWWEGQAGEPWRASLQGGATGERQGFASLDDLFDYIRCEAALARTGSLCDTRHEAICRQRPMDGHATRPA